MSSTMPGALLVDYGEVISEPQPADNVASMAALVGLDVPRFVERYWEHRPDYDRGGQAAAFWSKMAGADTIAAQALEQLIALDIDSWCVLNHETLELLMDAQNRGYTLALLSNAPHELAVRLSRHPALAFFDDMIFSAWIGVVKPERGAFDAAVKKLARPPGEILFVDDRPANVQGAIDAGLRAVHFTTAGALRDALAL